MSKEGTEALKRTARGYLSRRGGNEMSEFKIGDSVSRYSAAGVWILLASDGSAVWLKLVNGVGMYATDYLNALTRITPERKAGETVKVRNELVEMVLKLKLEGGWAANYKGSSPPRPLYFVHDEDISDE